MDEGIGEQVAYPLNGFAMGILSRCWWRSATMKSNVAVAAMNAGIRWRAIILRAFEVSKGRRGPTTGFQVYTM